MARGVRNLSTFQRIARLVSVDTCREPFSARELRVSQDPLPIDELVGPLLKALRSAQAVVVEAPPGAGKTPRLPRALLQAGWASEREIWVAQPGPLAAQLAAGFVARQLGESVGQRV